MSDQCPWVVLSVDKETTLCCGMLSEHLGKHKCVYCVMAMERGDRKFACDCGKWPWGPSRESFAL